jgi:hypothetical protein
MSTTDYDTPRTTDNDVQAESLEQLQTRREPPAGLSDLEELDPELLELPGADLSGETLTVAVLPKQADEFTCTRCFLVQHRTRQARADMCQDCI